MRALLVLLAVAAFGAVWLYAASGSWMIWPGMAIIAVILFRIWRELESVQEPSKRPSRLAARLGLPLNWSWGVGTALAGDGEGIGLQRRADGRYQGLALRYAEDADWSRVVLDHAVRLGVGLYGDFNVGWLAEERHGRPFGARKLPVPTRGITCYAVKRESVRRLLGDQPVQEALERLRNAVERLDAGRFVFDDRAVTVVARTPEIGEEILAAMHQFSTALQQAAPPHRASGAGPAPSTRAVIAWLGLTFMAIVTVLMLLGVIH